MTILTKTTSKGQVVVITLSRYLDKATATAHMDGKPIAAHETPYPVEQYYRLTPDKLKRVPAGVTHVLGQVGLTAAEAATVTAALEQAQAAIDQEPEVLARKLRELRDSLISSIRGWDETADEERDKAWERGDEAGAFVGRRVVEAQDKAAAAHKALAEFDAAHPEVKAAMQAEREAATARFLEID